METHVQVGRLGAELWSGGISLLVLLGLLSVPALAHDENDNVAAFSAPTAPTDRISGWHLPPVTEAETPPAAFLNEAYTAEPAGAEPAAEFYTLDELRAEMKKLAWTKGEYKIVPYGALWGSALYATERTSPGPYNLFVLSPTTEGEPDFEIDTRRTRLGLDVTGPTVPLFGGAQSGAKVEVDFFGFQPPFAVLPVAGIENRTGVLLRHAYAEVKNDDWHLLAGQTWDLISPLNPGTASYCVGWDGGNIGYRRMQIRLDRYLHVSDACMVSLQGAICQNVITDANSTSKPESVNWPIVEARLGFTLGDLCPGGQPVTCGFSGHIGEQGFDFTPGPNNDRIRTWSINGDLRVPITERFGFQGEFFTGDNLGTFLGGVGQGVNLVTQAGIRATGGWVEAWYDWTPRLHSHTGYGIDDPLDSGITAAAGRTYNQFLFGNLFFDVTKKLILGFEVTSWKTQYKAQLPGDAVTFEFSGQYGF
jgi:hypothetical protein